MSEWRIVSKSAIYHSLRMFLLTFQTRLPTKMEFENYLNDRSLDNADAAGDQAKMNQMSQAITSLMNVRLQDDYENVIDIDFNDTGEQIPTKCSMQYFPILLEMPG